MASSQGVPAEILLRNHLSVPSCDSPTTSGFLQDDIAFDLPRNDARPTDMEPMFAIDTQEWVTTQSAFLTSSGGMLDPSDASFIQEQERLPTDSWTHLTEVQGTFHAWPLETNMAPSVSDLTQLTDTISDSSSPISSASMGEIEGSCSPELMMQPPAVAPPSFDPLGGQQLPDWDFWNQGLATIQSPKTFLETSDSSTTSVQQPSLDQSGCYQSNESDPQKARSDWRYRLSVQEDGLYHCPFGGCGHSPDKLKCNYDKHLDSHLKPYRCKVKSCQDTAFSSTACVLRHEREAHGMHGHGNKPFMCLFPDCDRSNPESGFPRRWNLHDHMRRMHNYTLKSGSEETSDGRTTGPTRTKRGNRTSPKPRISKDDTIRASSSRKTSRPAVPVVWSDQQPPGQVTTQYMDVSHISPNVVYQSGWSATM